MILRLKLWTMVGTVSALFALPSAQPLLGQGDSAGCAGIAERARSAATARDFNVAMHDLRGCPDQLSIFVASAWSGGQLDTTRLGALRSLSQGLHDERVFGALLTELRNDAEPLSMRNSAMDALIGQVCPGRTLGGITTLRSGDSLTTLLSLGAVSEFQEIPGAQAIQGAPEQRFLAALGDVARSSADPMMRSLARAMTKVLTRPGRRAAGGC